MFHKYFHLPTYIALVIVLLGLVFALTFSGAPIPQMGSSSGVAKIASSGFIEPPAVLLEITPTARDLLTTATPPASDIGPNQPSIGQGATYYVATTGNDSNNGSESSPWRTIENGVKLLNPGDTLFLKSGTYVQTSTLTISSSGDTISGPITISTAPGEPTLAIITGDINGDGKAETPAEGKWAQLVYLKGSYLNFQNIEVAYSSGRGITSTGSNNIIFGNQVHQIWNGGIYVNGPNNIVENNTVWRAGDSNYCDGITGRRCNGDWASGIGWGDPHGTTPPGSAPYITVRGNQVYNNSGEGIICMHTDYGLIEGNVVYDNWALNIDLDQCSYTTIQKNLAYFTNTPLWWKQAKRPGSGIVLSNEGIKDGAGNTYPVGHDRKVINNILVGNGINFGFWAGQSLSDSALVNDLIAGNTMVEAMGSYGSNLSIDKGPHSNSGIINNIFFQSAGLIADVSTTDGLTFSNNLWSVTPPSSVSSPTDVVADPQLMEPAHERNPGAVLADWYKISSTSPSIGKGKVLPEIKVDYWDSYRDANPDIGANEYLP